MTSTPSFDIVLRNGRVMDPETGFDEICDVAIRGDAIAAIGPDLPAGATEIDVSGKIVAPGFIDLHGHGQSIAADRMQAFDGVTTSLELEIGALPVSGWYNLQAKRERVLNYGASVAWSFARRVVMSGLELDESMTSMETASLGGDDKRWALDTANAEQTEAIVDLVREGLAEGGIGVGTPNGYLPGTGVKELVAVCEATAEADSLTFTHIAFMANIDPKSSVESYARIIGLAGATGARMHVCHLNSTSLLDIEASARILQKAQSMGLPITTEAYPYGAGSTVVSAEFFLDPAFVSRTGSEYERVEVLRTGERFSGVERIKEVTQEDPGEVVIWHYLDMENEPSHQNLLDISVTYPGASIASDGLPWTMPDGSFYEGDAWPLPDDVSAHPRAAGTFTRFLSEYVRERKLVDLMEGIAKCTLYPAQVIECTVPTIRRKGRVQIGCDADLVVFDIDTVTDRATFADMNRASEGVAHLFVNGEPVIAGGELVLDARPGRAVRGRRA